MFTYEEMEKYLAEEAGEQDEAEFDAAAENGNGLEFDVAAEKENGLELDDASEKNVNPEAARKEFWERKEQTFQIRQKRERSLKRQCIALGAAAMILTAASAFSIYYDNRMAETNLGISKVGGEMQGIYGSDEAKTYAEPRIMTQDDIQEADYDADLLILVNKDNPLPENFEVELHYLNNGSCAVAEIMYDALAQMLSDGSDEGLSFVVASGYRDTQEQSRLLEEDIAATMEREGISYLEAYEYETRETMPPGYSEHETGLAVDIVSVYYQMLDERQEMTQESRWLREHCSEYGFILRYPKGKEDITGIDYESWHFRYVGEEAAEAIMSRGITLEEYLEQQKEN